MTDITPLIPDDRKVIDGYGGHGFRISRERFEGPVIVFPDRVVVWTVADATSLTADDFAAVTAAAPPVEILLVGCGPRAVLIPGAVRRAVRERGPVMEPMDTGAACRTYNVLLAEERRVAAALIPVG